MERVQFLLSKGFEMMKSVEGIITGFVFLFTMLVTIFKKMRIGDRIMHHYRKNKQLLGLRKGSEINNIISKLKDSGAISIVIIRYHNGGPYKMSVEWEVMGDPCKECIHQCAFANERKPLQKDWQKVKVNNVWAEIVSETIKLDGGLNTKHIEWYDSEHVRDNYCPSDIKYNVDIWKLYGINTFKEVLLKHATGKESFTLGLSFCGRFRDYEQADMKMEMARRRLKHLL